MKTELMRIAQLVNKRLNDQNLAGRTITLKITFSDFSKATRAITLDKLTANAEDLFSHSFDLLTKEMLYSKPIRLLGIGVSGFELKPEIRVIPNKIGTAQLIFPFMFED